MLTVLLLISQCNLAALLLVTSKAPEARPIVLVLSGLLFCVVVSVTPVVAVRRRNDAASYLLTWARENIEGREDRPQARMQSSIMQETLREARVRRANIQHLVEPFYLKVLAGKATHPPGPDTEPELLTAFQAVAGDVNLDQVIEMWGLGWRESLMASYWAGVHRWPELVAHVEPFLIPSRACYEGVGHCFALTRVPGPRSQAVLMKYLETYLPRRDLHYEQREAMTALVWVCNAMGQDLPEQYIRPWTTWSGHPPPHTYHPTAQLGLVRDIDHLERMHRFADQIALGPLGVHARGR